MRPFPSLRLLPILAGAAFLTSCQEDLQPEVDRLTTEVSDLRDEISRERDRVRDAQENNRELNRDVRVLEQEKKQIENEMRSLERQLAEYQKREEEAMAAEEAKPDASELKAAAREEAKTHAQARVTIKGDKSSGTGVLVEADGKNWIYLSPAVLSGNSRLEVTQSGGTPLKKFGAFEVLGNGQIARLEITEDPDHAIPMDEPAQLKSSAQLVAVDPSGTVTEGRAYSVKPDSMSTDSRIRALSAGTLVFHVEDGHLLGLLVPEVRQERGLWPNAYLSNRAPRSTCLRLDQGGDWSPVPIGSFLEEARVLAEADRFTRLLSAFAALQPGSGGVNEDVTVGGRMTVKEVFAENENVSAVRSFRGLIEWLNKNGERASSQDVSKRISSVYDEIQRLSAKETKALSERTFSPYHAETAKASLEWRKGAVEDMKRAATSVEP